MPLPPYRLAKARPNGARVLLVAACLLTAALTLLSQTPLPSGRAEAGRARGAEPDGAAVRLSEGYGELPLRFEANRGQAGRAAKFLARGSGYTLFLAEAGAVLRLRGAEEAGGEGKGAGDERGAARREATLRLRLEGANRSPKISGVGELAGRSNYLVGRDASRWRTGVTAFEKVRYESVYAGIDAVYYGRQGRLEYDFLVAPGANPARIRLAFDGARATRIDEGGDLVITTDVGDVRQQRPVAYQERDGARTEVAARYRLDARGRVRFELGDYDRQRALVIDPVLVYSSYLGGIDADQGLSVAVDSAGSAYVVGTTVSTDFPVTGGVQPVKGGVTDAFVLKLSPDGRSLVYATYLGGNGDDFANAVAVDSSGSAYVGGLTGSGGFPTTPGAFQQTKDDVVDAFVAKLNPAGTGLVYSTHIGGKGSEQVNSIVVDAAGAAHVAGRTDSPHFANAPGVTRAGSAAYRSADGGASWGVSNAGLTASVVSDFAAAPSDPNVVYAATNLAVYRSFDGGSNWQRAGEANFATMPRSTRSVVVDPTNAAVVYAGTSSGGGVYRSNDAGTTFAVKGNGLVVPSVNSLAVNPAAPATLFAGTVFGIYRTTDGGETWTEMRGGIPSGVTPNVNEVVVVPSPSSPQPVVYAATNNRGVLKSTDGGTNWAPANNGLTTFGTQPTTRTLAFDPANTSTLYAAVSSFPGGIYKSVDAGANWTNSSAGLSATINGQTFTPGVTALLVDPASPSTVYAATASAGVYKSTDGGANWSPSNAGLPNRSVQALAVRPGSPNVILAGTLAGGDGFVVKLNPAGSLPEYVRMLGGSDNDDARSVALGAGGSAYVVGTTSSTDFPLANAFQLSLGGSTDAHLSKLDATGATLYSTYLGGASGDQGAGVAVGPDGAAYVTGGTSSTDFPVANALQPAMAEFDFSDAFVTKFAPNGQTLAYSTYLGGAGTEQGLGIAVGADGGAYVAGGTSSANFPQVEPARGYGGLADAFVARFNPAGSALLFSTHLGGAANDQGNALAVNPAGEIFVVGNTASTDFPVVSAVRGTYGGGRSDAFVAKLGVEADLSLAVAESNDPVMVGNALSYAFNVTNAGPSPATGVTLSFTLPAGLSFVSAAPAQGSCSASGQAVTCSLASLPVSGVATFVVNVNPTSAGFANFTATVTANEPDHTRSNNGVEVATKISASPSIRGRVTAPGGAALAGVGVTLSGTQSAFVLTDANGFYQFAELAAGGNYVVTPSKEGVSFEPASRSYGGLGADQTADFVGTTCTWTLTPATQSFGAGGGTGAVTVNTLRGCPWTAASGSDWITVTSGASGTETGTVSFTVAPSSAPRAGRLTVAGQNFPVYQGFNSCGLPGFSAASYNLGASGPTLVEAGDLNGDGLADLVIATDAITGFDIQASVMLNDGAGGFTSSTFNTGYGGPRGIALGDFNSDARPDLVVWANAAVVGIRYNDGAGRFVPSTNGVNVGANVSPNRRAVIPADVNRDGKQDLLVTTYEPSVLRVLLGDGAGGFSQLTPLSTSVGNVGFRTLDVADVNGDGKVDLLLGSGSTGQISVRLGDGAGGFGANILSTAITFPSEFLTGDFDADGKLDLVYLATVCDFSSSNCAVSIVVMAGDGAGHFTQRSRTDNINAFGLAVADFNGDGKLDVAHMQAGGTPLVRRGDGLGGFVSPAPAAAEAAEAQALSSSSSSLATADFNKDGRPDLAVPAYNFGAAVYTNRCASSPSISGRITDTGTSRGLAGVTVSVSGAQAATAQTDEGGNYLIDGLAAGANYVVTPSKENYRFSPASASVNGLAAAGQTADFSGTPMAVRLAANHHVVAENLNTFLKIDVVRTGDTSGPAAVDYSTGPGTYNTASDRSDYTYAGGTLRFAPGETTRSFNVLLNDDRLLESWESLTVNLSNPTGALLGFVTSALVEVRDDELSQPASNPIDESHVFVRQHYHDFLNREPDQSGLEFWTWEIEQCGADAQCREVRRVNVSAAFFLSIEFQETGYLVYRTHTAAFGTGRALDQKTFLRETQQIGAGVVVGPGDAWKAQLEANKQAYVNAFVQRPEFAAAYPPALTPAQYVDALNANTGGSLSQGERDALVASLTSSSATRAGVLRAVAENAEFSRRELNKAFVLTQYFGYLRRGPSESPDSDFSGYNFWLGKLNEFGGNYIAAEMVKAFINSAEYRKRFGQ